jgi:hypothetical protein
MLRGLPSTCSGASQLAGFSVVLQKHQQMFADLPNLVQQVYESLDIGTSGFV